jgi:hypothetical protein
MGEMFFSQKICCPKWQNFGHIDYSQNNGKKTLVKTNVSKWSCPKWHFEQVG